VFLFCISQTLLSQTEKEDLTKFGLQLESSLESLNPYYFNLSFDVDLMLLNVFDSYGISPDQEYHQGFIDGIHSKLDLGTLLVNQLQRESDLELISVRPGSHPSLIFRLAGSQGINYHEYFIEVQNDDLKLSDAYIYSSGQRISEEVGELYVTSCYPIISKSDAILEKVNEQCLKGNYKKAYHQLSKLPESAMRKKTNLMLAVDIASRIDAPSFLEAYSEFIQYFPEEPGKYLIPLDGLIAFGLYDIALENIDKLDEAVLKDPILNFVRANIYYQSDKSEEAEIYLYKLIEEKPDYEPGYISLLDIFLREKSYNEATDLLNQMVITFQNYKEDYIPFFVNYLEFINLKEYKDWL
jgi:tetratricopeptide (TPR) repeat protein